MGAENEPSRRTSFLVTYGPVPRIWCEVCDKAKNLEVTPGVRVTPETVNRLREAHVCGPRTSPWES
jgi:hypothetical protein